jgi:uncharacterized membrane protein YkvA (DUF1232 family)
MKNRVSVLKGKGPWEKVVDVAGDPVRLVQYLTRLLQDDRVPKSSKLKLLGSGLYGWIDGDLVPDDIDALPGLGYVDDIILIVHGIKCLIAETDKQVAVALWPGDEASFRRVLTAVAWLDDQLFERIRGTLSNAFSKLFGGAGNNTPEGM